MGKVVAREDTLRYQLVGLIPHLRRFARGLTKDADKADDLVQEACERALKKLNSSGEELNLTSLLYRIIYNRWIDNLRRRKTRFSKLLVLSEQNKFKASDPHSDDRLDAMLDLQGALDKLDDEHRAAIDNFPPASRFLYVHRRFDAKIVVIIGELLPQCRGQPAIVQIVNHLGIQIRPDIKYVL